MTPSPTPNQFIQLCTKQNTCSDTTSSCNFEEVKFDSNRRISFIKNAHQKTTLMGQSYYCSFRTIPNSLSIHKLIAFIRPPNPQKNIGPHETLTLRISNLPHFKRFPHLSLLITKCREGSTMHAKFSMKQSIEKPEQNSFHHREKKSNSTWR